MKRTLRIITLAIVAGCLSAPALAHVPPQQSGTQASKRRANGAKPGGGGTPGRIAKFGSNGNVADSNITEDDAGNIGVGTTLVTSPLTVNGVVETTGEYGGIKFPDGTVLTSAEVRHNPTLTGSGTDQSVLGVAVPLFLSGYDTTGILTVTNTFRGDAMRVFGGYEGIGVNVLGGGGSHGILSRGGFSETVGGGYGLIGSGGSSNSGVGGYGVAGNGGNSNTGPAGTGVDARGGSALGCCNGVHSNAGFGGHGMRAVGGNGFGLGKRGGHGIETFPGAGTNGAAAGLAGKFNGDVQVTGVLSKGGGSFKIDHPLDPENRYLSHSFVESPDMKNIYDGVITLDGNGEAVVEMPEWFDALNRDYRYLLTAIGAPMPGLYVAEKIRDNRFKISGGQAGMEVSWQVTGTRQDAWANKHRIPVEEEKPEIERGYYLHPEAFDKDEERGVSWAYEPERMQQEKERRLEVETIEQPQE